MKKLILYITTILLFCTTLLLAQESETTIPLTSYSAPPTDISESLQRETQAAVDRGLQWLISKQNPEGYWSNPTFPALTALPLWALVKGGCTDTNVINRAVSYILTCVHPDGAIFREPTEKRKGGGLPNYNTALCMVALHATGRKGLTATVLKARDYMADHQLIKGGDTYHGGFGYDPATGRDYTDLSNSYLAYEAMRLTQDAEDLRANGTEKTDIDWQAAQEFLQNTQNDPAVNTNTWASSDPAEKGGFAYHPKQTRAGTITQEDGTVKFRSMPGMTYAGLLSYIYADVDRTDPRVKATVQWIKNNWNLEQSSRDPEKIADGRDQEGLFYLYNVMSKGLNAYGTDVLTPDNAPAFNWRQQLIERLLSKQQITTDGTGYWVNPTSRYWEGDPVLVTAYALLALEIAVD